MFVIDDSTTHEILDSPGQPTLPVDGLLADPPVSIGDGLGELLRIEEELEDAASFAGDSAFPRWTG